MPNCFGGVTKNSPEYSKPHKRKKKKTDENKVLNAKIKALMRGK